MSDDINTVHLRGTLVFDATLYHTSKGSTILQFKLEMKSARGSSRANVKVWGVEPDIMQCLKKGTRVEVSGRLKDDSYDNKKHPGEKVYTTDVVVERDALVILEVGGAPARQPQGEQQTRRQPVPPRDEWGAGVGDMEDIPFAAHAKRMECW